MDDRYRLDELRRDGRLRWMGSQSGWLAQPNVTEG